MIKNKIIHFQILKTIQYLGHIMRNNCKYDLQQRILHGKIDDKSRLKEEEHHANLRTWFDKSSVELFQQIGYILLSLFVNILPPTKLGY